MQIQQQLKQMREYLADIDQALMSKQYSVPLPQNVPLMKYRLNPKKQPTAISKDCDATVDATSHGKHPSAAERRVSPTGKDIIEAILHANLDHKPSSGDDEILKDVNFDHYYNLIPIYEQLNNFWIELIKAVSRDSSTTLDESQTPDTDAQ